MICMTCAFWRKGRHVDIKRNKNGKCKEEGLERFPCAGAAASTAFDSTKHNMPTVRFGNALRDSQQLLFISKEHDKSSGGRDSPG